MAVTRTAVTTTLGGTGLKPDELLELIRIQASASLDPARRTKLGQYFTPPRISRLMASMFSDTDAVDLIDPGAGSGSLLAAAILDFARRDRSPSEISVTAYEIEPAMAEYLRRTIEVCHGVTNTADVTLSANLHDADFIEIGVSAVQGGLFSTDELPHFSHAILNPPYGKVRSDSPVRSLLRGVGIEAGNLYVAFLALAISLLRPGGELVAITPRSFCNGPYFRPFRRWLLNQIAIDRIHIFESRSAAFQEDHVLQENIILHGVKSPRRPEAVTVSSSTGDGDEMHTVRTFDYDQIVQPNDADAFIHVISDDWGAQVADSMSQFTTRLETLGLNVSTGRVVDFRSRSLLRDQPGHNTVPLIYPSHFDQGYISWPRKSGRKPNALADNGETEGLTLPPGAYVLVKRFSAKEEARRVVAAIYDSELVSPLRVGLENHLNYYHRNGASLDPLLARGLAAYLNSSLVDHYFRLFSGHTQVNATDLRRMPYPPLDALLTLGQQLPDGTFPSQRDLDSLVHEVLRVQNDPIEAKQRIEEALEVLEAIEMPRAQLNERSALTLLALLDLQPNAPWSSASNPLRGITPIMEFARDHYGRNYAPNTRETIRRQTMHQFVDAGIAIPNPDDPDRPVNSPDFVYQIEGGALELMRCYGTANWSQDLAAYLASAETLRTKYAQEREMRKIAIRMPDGVTLNLTPGGQNVLIEKILDEFCPRFTPGGVPLYVGDTGDKFAYFDRDALDALGVQIEQHGKMPDVLVHHVENDWLVIVEAVTSHGPVNPKRQRELKTMFSACRAGLVFITAFLSRQAMLAYLSEIAWETEVWSADDPSHLIHFDGERFLGPY